MFRLGSNPCEGETFCMVRCESNEQVSRDRALGEQEAPNSVEHPSLCPRATVLLSFQRSSTPALPSPLHGPPATRYCDRYCKKRGMDNGGELVEDARARIVSPTNATDADATHSLLQKLCTPCFTR